MNVRIVVGAEAAYACIEPHGQPLDIKLSPGRSASQSLRETAEAWRIQAAHLNLRALIASEAAALLDEADSVGGQQ